MQNVLLKKKDLRILDDKDLLPAMSKMLLVVRKKPPLLSASSESPSCFFLTAKNGEFDAVFEFIADIVKTNNNKKKKRRGGGVFF